MLFIANFCCSGSNSIIPGEKMNMVFTKSSRSCCVVNKYVQNLIRFVCLLCLLALMCHTTPLKFSINVVEVLL